MGWLRRTIESLLLVVAVTGSSALAQQRCGLAKDLVVHALEGMTPASTQEQLRDADQLLKRATQVCAEQGDAWYYRAVLAEKSGNPMELATAQAARHRAILFSSEAQQQGLNPFLLAAPKGTTRGERVRQKWALVVGVSHFQDKSVDTLEFTSDDAQSFSDVLLDPNVGHFSRENVHVLLNEQATTRNLKVELNWLARNAQPDDLVVIYIATHGSPRSMDTVGANYLVTYDTEIGVEGNPDLLFATAFPMVDVSSVVASRIRATRVAVFLDTCYSEGAMAAGESAGPRKQGLAAAVSTQTLDHIRQGAGRVIVAASKSDQESMESAKLRHGYFTFYLVQALREQNGAKPLSQVFAYVQDHVSSKVAQDFKAYGWHQDPVMSRSEPDTDFSLGEAAVTQATAGGKVDAELSDMRGRF